MKCEFARRAFVAVAVIPVAARHQAGQLLTSNNNAAV
jgi:hypothetical protein